MTKHTTLPIDDLRALIDYDPSTGVITRKSNGKPALFTVNHNGYLWGRLRQKVILAHRAAWAWAHGEWVTEIDHINRIKIDNRLINLRAASRAVQMLNLGHRRAKEPDYFGVGYLPGKDRWIARFRGHYLGCFATAEAAARAYDAKAIPAGIPSDLLNFGVDREPKL